MHKSIKKFILTSVMLSSVCINCYAEDRNYNNSSPNYNDPSKPNYMGGTRTDMAPKVEIDNKEEDNRKKDYRCVPSQEVQKTVVDAYDSRYDDSPTGITSLPQVIGASKLWDEECKKQEEERQKLKKMPSQPIIKSAE